MIFEPVNIVQIAIASPAAMFGLVFLGQAHLRALAALMLVFAAHMILNVLEETGVSGDLLLTPALSLLYGPLFYIFIRGLVLKNRTLRLRDLVHALPFLLAFVAMGWLWLVRCATVASLLTYSAASLVNIWRYNRGVKVVRSDADALRLNWILAVFAGFVGLTVLDGIRMITSAFHSMGFGQSYYAASLLAVAALFGVLGYYAVNRPRFFEGLSDAELSGAASPSANVRQTGEAEQEMFERIERAVEKGALYEQPHLTLLDLANATSLPERDLSRLINQISGRNFCDYINGFRVRAAAERLAAPEHASETILSIAFEAGFSSKSTFNAVFKRELGQTPSSFRKFSLAARK